MNSERGREYVGSNYQYCSTGGLVNFYIDFKGTPSLKEHKTIISGLMIDEIALFDQIDFLAFLCLHKMT